MFRLRVAYIRVRGVRVGKRPVVGTTDRVTVAEQEGIDRKIAELTRVVRGEKSMKQ